MSSLLEKCCDQCRHSPQTPCKDSIKCRIEGPICHDDLNCKQKRLDRLSLFDDIIKYYQDFTQNDCCGKCAPCREGTTRILEILTRICAYGGESDDIENLERLSRVIINTSLCGLGLRAPNPVLATLQYFSQGYEADILDKCRPASACASLSVYAIDREKCTGCGACARVCPAEAISGEKKQPHTIDVMRCANCDNCMQKCKFDSIYKN
ncbi:MAG: 4Fe-4S binding protein [Firmicutes bacterium]|nr:4Fe-4S binding protein [Bacillota bacterium]